MALVTCDLRGGLGNQLFQIAATLAYAERHGLRPVFSDAIVLSRGDERWAARCSHFSGVLAPLAHLCVPLHEQPGWPHWKRVCADQHEYRPLPPPDGASVCLVGYFQSPRYFEDAVGAVLRALDCPRLLAEARLAVRPEAGPRRVGLHFRLGDYKSLQEVHVITPPAYYAAAVAELRAEGQEYFYVCEDEDAAHVAAVYLPPIEACAGRPCRRLRYGTTDGHELLALACCDAFVIANSTFSWWAANLSEAADKQVYYPLPWFGPNLAHLDTRDMFPPSWRALNWADASSPARTAPPP